MCYLTLTLYVFLTIQASSVKGQPTIKTKDPFMQYVIGRADKLSFYDYKGINLMYGCNGKHPFKLWQ